MQMMKKMPYGNDASNDEAKAKWEGKGMYH
jgi:hypothetical protein